MLEHVYKPFNRTGWAQGVILQRGTLFGITISWFTLLEIIIEIVD